MDDMNINDKLLDNRLTVNQIRMRDSLKQLFLSEPIVNLQNSLQALQAFMDIKEDISL